MAVVVVLLLLWLLLLLLLPVVVVVVVVVGEGSPKKVVSFHQTSKTRKPQDAKRRTPKVLQDRDP